MRRQPDCFSLGGAPIAAQPSIAPPWSICTGSILGGPAPPGKGIWPSVRDRLRPAVQRVLDAPPETLRPGVSVEGEVGGVEEPDFQALDPIGP